MTNVYKDQAAAILVNQFSNYAKKLTDFSNQIYDVIVEKGPYYDDMMSEFQESEECLNTLSTFLNDQGYTFTQGQLKNLAEELIFNADGMHGVYPNLFNEIGDLLQEVNIALDGVEFMNGYQVLFDWIAGEGVCELSYYGDDEKTGLLLNAKNEYETLQKEGIEAYISCLLSRIPVELYERIINGELDYDSVINENQELKEDFITIEEIKANENTDGEPLIDSRIPNVIEEAMEILSVEKDFAQCSQRLIDYARNNLNIVENTLENTEKR